MTHSDSFKMKSGMRIILLALVLGACNLFSSCAKHDEVDFSGTLIDVRSCTTLNISADRNAAHIVALDTPTGVGGNYEGYTNVIVLFEPTKHVTVGDHIHGTFYFDDKYSKTTCSWRNTDYDLPEGVFTKTYID